MRESPFGFSYSWADLAPIRILAVSIFVGQVAGGAVQWVRSPYADWFLNIWTGGALGGFAGYLVGLLLPANYAFERMFMRLRNHRRGRAAAQRER
jgi:hypothetical protein